MTILERPEIRMATLLVFGLVMFAYLMAWLVFESGMEYYPEYAKDVAFRENISTIFAYVLI